MICGRRRSCGVPAGAPPEDPFEQPRPTRGDLDVEEQTEPAAGDPDRPGDRENQAEIAKAMDPAHRSVANRPSCYGIRSHGFPCGAGTSWGTVCSHSAGEERGVSLHPEELRKGCPEVRQGRRESAWVDSDPHGQEHDVPFVGAAAAHGDRLAPARMVFAAATLAAGIASCRCDSSHTR